MISNILLDYDECRLVEGKDKPVLSGCKAG